MWSDPGKGILDRVFTQTLRLYHVGDIVTDGYGVSKQLIPVCDTPGLVQTISLPTSDGALNQLISVKTPPTVALSPGMVVEILESSNDPDMVGHRITLDSVSASGVTLIRKATAHEWAQINPQGGA